MSVPPLKIEEDLEKATAPTPSADLPQTGIVNNATQPTAQVDITDPVDAPAQMPELTPANERLNLQPAKVSDEINELTAGGNRYIEQARRDNIRESNSRGLINSNMAGAAGVEAAIRSALPIASQDAQAYNRFLENRQSTDLNMEIETLRSNLNREEMRLDSKLKTEFEITMNDERMSDEVKLQYVNTINEIMRDAQQQIVAIGTSDRSAAAQAAAIARVEANRNASIKVYQDLLKGFDDWEWGTDFTPGDPAAAAPAPGPGQGPAAAPSSPPRSQLAGPPPGQWGPDWYGGK